MKKVIFSFLLLWSILLIGCGTSDQSLQEQYNRIDSYELITTNFRESYGNTIQLVCDDDYHIEIKITPANVTEKDFDLVNESEDKISVSDVRCENQNDSTLLSLNVHVKKYSMKSHSDGAHIKIIPKNGKEYLLSIGIVSTEFYDPEPITMNEGETVEVIFKVRPAYKDISEFYLHGTQHDFAFYDENLVILDTERDYKNNCQYIRTQIKCIKGGRSHEHALYLTDRFRYSAAKLNIYVPEYTRYD